MPWTFSDVHHCFRLTPHDHTSSSSSLLVKLSLSFFLPFSNLMAARSPSVLRLLSDFKEVSNDPLEVLPVQNLSEFFFFSVLSPSCPFFSEEFLKGASASPASENNMFYWTACMFGPSDTAWEGGVFNMTLTFSDDYPATPPTVRFTTPIYHPNGMRRLTFLSFNSQGFYFSVPGRHSLFRHLTR
jgi:hypothetical protein